MMNCCKINDGGSPLKKSKKLPPMAVDSSATKNEEKVALLNISLSNANVSTTDKNDPVGLKVSLVAGSAESTTSPINASVKAIDQENLRPTTAITEREKLLQVKTAAPAAKQTEDAATARP